MRTLLFAALLGLLGCPRADPRFPRPRPLDVEATGLSGLTVDGEGALWAVPEDARSLLRIDPRTGAIRTIPLRGVPEGAETESITWLEGRRFALGTERGEDGRSGDDILVVAVLEDAAHVQERILYPYGLWSLEGDHNTGIEGLCHVDGALFVAAEVVGLDRGRRFAPLARRGRNGQWTTYRLWLTTVEGKLSALACRPAGPDAVELFAIERHFGTTRVLRARVSVASTLGEDVQPEVLADLDGWIREQDPSPNFEGIALLPGRLVLVLDNRYQGRVTQPNALHELDLGALRARPLRPLRPALP
ncbi:MAG TPA: SdiA-regulated domain-containing protein [Polyangiaceae bacterium LLY-WYZ-15_(1-7)]|nr:hypothetical protein [Sandaracinus sp.]HJL04201.1 SdiA-regulated domain-containing protein [Polyangiaceae bacterium LLY-WYZ-15_(1-7)]MBJ74113.1 hypothetical protein [Sandaracinus sp.]HJL10439.1 SdiA-regulated domain-containing protein [Polyangiaceae bacterium LLY-WYZ-15_(1-7)]HJL26932.1 SdiA-regulated domain-containing protein [Polyangiaceae bacterium LLY-WYZ-15_(1-7)]